MSNQIETLHENVHHSGWWRKGCQKLKPWFPCGRLCRMSRLCSAENISYDSLATLKDDSGNRSDTVVPIELSSNSMTETTENCTHFHGVSSFWTWPHMQKRRSPLSWKSFSVMSASTTNSQRTTKTGKSEKTAGTNWETNSVWPPNKLKGNTKTFERARTLFEKDEQRGCGNYNHWQHQSFSGLQTLNKRLLKRSKQALNSFAKHFCRV